jgi:phospholipid-binding lipoprotein MlaA
MRAFPLVALTLVLASLPAMAQLAPAAQQPTPQAATTQDCVMAAGEDIQAASACAPKADTVVAETPRQTASAPVAAPEASQATTEAAQAGNVAPASTEDATAQAPASGDAAAQQPTQAELDYAALYGTQDYNPIADPTLPAPAELPASYDPWEGLNRTVHRFNNAVDRRIAKPLAHAYVATVPRPVRLGVSNFFANLGQPVAALNALLQGKPKQAAQALGRFTLNATLGIGGIFDPASDAHLPYRDEDFGQTLGMWGWKRSRYVELPLFGPRTVRDVFGLVGDGQLAPLRQVEDDPTRVFLQGLQLVDVRTQLFAVDSMREGAADDYALVRDAWLQRRRYQIFGDRKQQDDELPEYLREDTGNPSVPADAMPIMPSGGN